MNILIVEDEFGAAKNLQTVLNEIDSEIKTLAIIESIQDAVSWIRNNPAPELAFFDIQLADGSAFEIFEQVQIEFPIIFTTAYDQYAIKAFKVNSIDYILKPVRTKDVKFALDKYQKLYSNKEARTFANLSELILELRLNKKRESKKTFLIHYQDRILPVSVSDFAYFLIENSMVYGITFQKQKYVVDQKLDGIEEQISSEDFFRINRQYIVSRKAVKEAAHYFNGRLILKAIPQPKDQLLVSKAKVADFKNWLRG